MTERIINSFFDFEPILMSPYLTGSSSLSGSRISRLFVISTFFFYKDIGFLAISSNASFLPCSISCFIV
jgi:hypothetical protein